MHGGLGFGAPLSSYQVLCKMVICFVCLYIYALSVCIDMP